MNNNWTRRLAGLLLAAALVISPVIAGIAPIAAAEDTTENIAFDDTTQPTIYVAGTPYTLKLISTKGTTTKDVSASATWLTTNESVVKVDKGILTAVDEGSAVISAKYNGVTRSITVTAKFLFKKFYAAKSASPSQVETELKLMLGDSLNLTAQTMNDNSELNNVTTSASWTSSDPDVVTASKGKITPVGEGDAEITLTYKGMSSVIDVTVSKPYESLTIGVDQTNGEPPAELLVGAEQQLTAIAKPESGQPVPVTSLAKWTSSNPAVITVDKGKLKAVGRGMAKITAEHLGVKDEFSVYVRLAYQAIELLPQEDVTLFLSEGSVQLSAKVLNSTTDDKVVTADPETVWTSSDPLVATVSGGKVTLMAPGTAVIKAAYRGLQEQVSVNVLQNVSTFTLDKTTIDTYRNDSDKLPTLKAKTIAGDQIDVSSLVKWSSNSSNVEIKDGKWIAKGTGEAILTGVIRKYSDKEGTDTPIFTGTVKVAVKEKALTLLPSFASYTIYAGQEITLPTVTAVLENGDELTVTDIVEWKASSANLLIRGNKAKGLAASKVNLTGTYLNKTITIPVAIEEEVISFDIVPENVMFYPGKTQSIKVTGITKSGKKVSIGSKITWSIGNTAVATVKGASVKAVGEGSTVLRGSYQGKPVEVPVNVYLRLLKLTLSERSLKFSAGSVKALKVTGTYDTGRMTDVTSSVTWTSSNPSAATVVNGVVTAVKKGSTSIKATYQNKSVTIRVTVY
ncbi:Ig-like domain-containing protein [Paenibacillus gansuensis]|uniref:Ig-like domain-containing protein n=1 Tax=Paenibacillus gansuensis TaxID=306542 RepID=A0ABW5PEM7_9BACL